MDRDQPVVLIVDRDVDTRDRLEGWLEDVGFGVVVCAGPSAPEFTCVGSREGRCPLAQDADLVVLDLWLESDAAMMGTRAASLPPLRLVGQARDRDDRSSRRRDGSGRRSLPADGRPAAGSSGPRRDDPRDGTGAWNVPNQALRTGAPIPGLQPSVTAGHWVGWVPRDVDGSRESETGWRLPFCRRRSRQPCGRRCGGRDGRRHLPRESEPADLRCGARRLRDGDDLLGVRRRLSLRRVGAQPAGDTVAAPGVEQLPLLPELPAVPNAGPPGAGLEPPSLIVKPRPDRNHSRVSGPDARRAPAGRAGLRDQSPRRRPLSSLVAVQSA
jgi:hypothetical protein